VASRALLLSGWVFMDLDQSGPAPATATGHPFSTGEAEAGPFCTAHSLVH